MAIGLTKKGLIDYFEEQFKSIHDGLQKSQSNEVKTLMKGGYSEREAFVQANAERRLLASAQALLATISQNNQRIQAQLEQKGF
ncbi:MAG: hypothetical protein ABR958_00135 [Dehalococcoidales bacterium]